MIKESYKHRTSKEKNDTNIDLSVQPWGRDGDNRRYWLIEGRDDTPFRIYRESNPKLKTNTWWSVAGSIGEIRALAQKLEDEDGTRDAKQLAERIRNAIPRFEATEEVPIYFRRHHHLHTVPTNRAPRSASAANTASTAKPPSHNPPPSPSTKAAPAENA